MSMKTLRLARWLAGTAGVMDAATGLGLVFLPELTLRAMGVGAPTGDARVFLGWVGAFVGAVGASYLIALARGGASRLREVFVFTLVFRAAAGGYAAWAVASGALDWRWITVALTDGTLVAVQLWLLRREGWHDE